MSEQRGLEPHSLVEEPIVEHANGVGEGRTPPGHERPIAVIEDLSEPPVLLGAASVKVNREPEALFGTAGVEDTEQLSRLDVDNPKVHTTDCLMEKAERIRLEMKGVLAAERVRGMVQATGNEMVAAVVELRSSWKSDAVDEVIRRFLMS